MWKQAGDEARKVLARARTMAEEAAATAPISLEKSRSPKTPAKSTGPRQREERIDGAREARMRPTLRLVSSRCIETALPQPRSPRGVVSIQLVLVHSANHPATT